MPELGEVSNRMKTVTDALVEVMEKADDLENVVILCNCKGGMGSVIVSDGFITAAETNWLLDHAKAWLMGLRKREDL